MREGTGWYVVHEAMIEPDREGLDVHQGTMVCGDGARVEALPVGHGFERRGVTFWGADLDGALRHATLVARVGRVPSDAGPSVLDPEHLEVACGDAVAERALRAKVAPAYETSDALGVRYSDAALVAEVMRTGVDLRVTPASVDGPGPWPEEPGDDAPSP